MAKIGTKTAVKTPIGQDFSNTPKGGVPTITPQAPNYSIKQGVPNYA